MKVIAVPMPPWWLTCQSPSTHQKGLEGFSERLPPSFYVNPHDASVSMDNFLLSKWLSIWQVQRTLGSTESPVPEMLPSSWPVFLRHPPKWNSLKGREVNERHREDFWSLGVRNLGCRRPILPLISNRCPRHIPHPDPSGKGLWLHIVS